MARVGRLVALTLCLLFALSSVSFASAPNGTNIQGAVTNGSTNTLPVANPLQVDAKGNAIPVIYNNGVRRDLASEPDDAGYLWRDNDENNGPRFEWLDMADYQNVREFRMGDDQNSGALDLGFAFPFWGTDFRQIYLDSDGWVSFTCGSTPYRLPVQNWPTQVGQGAAYDKTICWTSMDFTAGTEIWYWTNNQDQAIVWWAGNHSEQAQMILDANGKVTINYGVNCQDRPGGVNVGDGRHGWYWPAGNGYFTNGRSIAFGPRAAWIQFEGPGISVDPEELNFGEVYLDFDRTIDVEVINVGAQDLTISALDCEEGAYILPDFGQDVVLGSGDAVSTQVIFRPTEVRDYTTDIYIICDAENAQDGAFAVRAIGRGATPPVIGISPSSFEEEVNSGDTLMRTIELTNEGGGDLNWWTEINVIREGAERDANGRGIRSLSSAGPRRDEVNLDGMLFANFQTNSVWGWLDDGMKQDPLLDENNFHSYRNAADWDNVNFEDYDVICVSAYSQQFNAQYQNNLERFEDYIAGGGCAYFETGNTNQAILSPGGIYNDINGGSSNGQLIVSPDPNADNYSLFAEICHESQPNFWNEGEIIEGSSWLHATYSNQQFDDRLNNGTIEWYQPIASVQNNVNSWGAIAYGFGSGAVMTVGHPSAHCWFNYNQEGMWGSVGAEILFYLTEVGRAPWISVVPEEGAIVAGQSGVIDVTLGGEHLLQGNYEADLFIHSNDPADPMETVNIKLWVQGVPDIVVEWDEGFGFPQELNFNRAYRDVFAGTDYPVTVRVINDGTSPLEITNISCDQNEFIANPNQLNLAAGDEADVTITFSSDQVNTYEGQMIFDSNDPDSPELEVFCVGQTFGPPLINVSPMEFQEEVNSGDTLARHITIENTGDADLVFSTEIEILAEGGGRDANGRGIRSLNGNVPNRDEAGELLGQFQGINAQNQYSSCVGWDWDNERMWVTNYISATAAAYTHDANYQNFQEEVRIQPGNTMDGCWAEGYFFLGNFGSNVINRYDANGQNVGAIQFPWGVYGLAADLDEGWLFAQSGNDMFIYVFELDGNGGVNPNAPIGSIQNHMQFHANQQVYGLEWVGKHADGQLWMTSPSDRRVHQIMVDTDNWTCTGEFQAFNVFPGADQPYSSVAHDGKNLWASGYAPATIRIYDDGVAETQWIVLAPEEGTIAGGASAVLDLTLGGEKLVEGQYNAIIYVYSNDPDAEVIEVVVDLYVHGVPNIVVEWNPAFGFPNQIDWNEAYPDLFTGTAYDIPVTVMNEGTAPLVIDDISGDNGAFTSNPASLNIAAGEEATVVFTLLGDADAVHEDWMVFTSNDPDSPSLEVLVRGETGSPPEIGFNPNAVSEELFTGGMVDRAVTVFNRGGSPLRFTVEQVEIEQGRDANARGIRSLSGASSPNRDDAGDIIAEYRIDYPSTVGLAYDADNELVWGYSNNPGGTIFAFDPAQGEIVRTFNAREKMDGLAYHEGRLYINGSARDPQLVVVDLEGNEIERRRVPVNLWNGHRFFTIAGEGDEAYFLIRTTANWGGENTDAVMVYSFPDMNQVARIPDAAVTGDQTTAGVLWTPNVREGQLWVDGCDRIYQLAVDDDWNCQVVQSFNVAGTEERAGLAYDGKNIWRAVRMWRWGGQMDDHTMLQCIDNGVAEAYWLTVTPEEAEIAANSQLDANFAFNATGLDAGVYEAEVFFHSNDPQDPNASVMVSLEVTGAPDIIVEWDEAAGFEQGVIDFNPVFPDLFCGGRYPLTITIINDGSDDLTIDAMWADNDWFSFDPESPVISPHAEQDVVILFAPPANQPDDINCTLTIPSNDPDENPITISMHARAYLPPQIIVEPQLIEEALRTGEVADPILQISNDGDADLRWNIEYDITAEGAGRDANGRGIRNLSGAPARDDAGELIAQFQPANLQQWHRTVCGWDWDNERMWITNYSGNNAAAFSHDANYENFNQEIMINNIGNNMDGCWADGYLFMPTSFTSSQVNRWDANGQNIGAINFPFGVCGMASDMDEEWLFVISGNDWSIQVYQLDGEGNVDPNAPIGAINNWRQFANNENPYGLEWVGNHREGQLWVTSPSNMRVHEILVDTDQWTCVEEFQNFVVFPNAENPYSGVGHDGEFLWSSGSNFNTVRIYDDGVNESRWLTIIPEEGVTVADQTTDVNIHLDAAGLVGGHYEASLHVLSNDVDFPDIEVIVSLDVTGAPDIEVTWEEGLGFPQEVNFNSGYPELYFGGPYPLDINVANIGTDMLHITDISVEGEAFSVIWDPETHTDIQYDTEFILPVIMNAPAAGDWEGTVTIECDDEDEPTIDIFVHGSASSPPRISLSRNLIEDELFTGDIRDYDVQITNEGQSPLHYEVEIEAQEPGERDANARGIRSLGGPARAEVARDRRGEPDDLDYEWRDNDENDGPEYEWIDIREAEGVRTFQLGDDQNTGRVDLGFDFPFYDRVQNFIYIDSDAWVSLVNQSQQITIPRFPSADANWYYTFGICNGDWHGNMNGSGPLYFWTNNRDMAVITYHQWEDRGGGSHADFQVILYSSGLVKMQYGARFGDGNRFARDSHAGFNGGDGQHGMEIVPSGQGAGYLVEGRAIAFGPTSAFTNWISFEPKDHPGIEAGQTIEGFLTLDATGLLGGRYTAQVNFISNDPVNPGEEADAVIEVVMVVTGVANIDVTPGGPEENGEEGPVNFGVVYYGYPESVSVEVANAGTDDLELLEVLPDQNNGDFTVNADDFDGWILTAGEARNLNIWYAPTQENGEGDIEATLLFRTNDPRYPDGYPVHVAGTALVAPVLFLDPNELNEVVEEGDIGEPVVNISNDGGSTLNWEAEIEVIFEPNEGRDANGRGIRSLSNAGPRRDEVNLDGMLFANFQTNSVWGWLDDGMKQDPLLDENNFHSYRNAADWDNVDFEQYDVICVSAYSQQFNQQYANNLERFEAYIDGGGCAYFETGNTNQAILSPGGIYNDINGGAGNGQLIVSPDPNAENYSLFAEICHESQPNNWNEGEVIEGSSWLHSTYSRQQFDDRIDNGTIEWYQPIASVQNNVNSWGAITYGFGRGAVMTVGHPSAHCWFNYNQIGMWGSVGAEILFYLTEVGGAKWISMEPMDGSIAVGGNQDVIVALNGVDVLGGDYQADIHFYSNDPENPDQVLTVNLHVNGRSVFLSEPAPESNLRFPLTYLDTSNPLPVTFQNGGSQAYTITGFNFDGANPGDFATDLNGNLEVPPRGEVVVNFMFVPTATGERSATIHLVCDAMNVEGEDVFWNLSGNAMLPPALYTRPENVVPRQYVAAGGNAVDFGLILGNEEGNDRDVVRFEVGSRPVDEGRDASSRAIRSLSGSNVPGPRRDAPESAFLLIQGSNPWGYDMEQIFRNEQDLNYTRINTPDELRNVDLDNFGAMWVVGNEESSDWYQQYNNNAATIDQWVDDGGAYYMSTGTNTFDPAPVHPGGLVRTPQVYDNTGITQLTQEENLLFDLMDWDQGTRLAGNSFVHCVYEFNAIDNIENTDGAQIMVLTADNGQRPAVLNYNYGRGMCVVAGTTDGFLHAQPQQYIWGASGSAMLWYLDALANSSIEWLTVSPEEGALNPGEEVELTLTYNSLDLPEGDYFGELVIESNDVDTPEMVLGVSMNVGDGVRRLVHFTNFTETAPNHSIIVTGIAIEETPASTGWEVGVFTPDSVLSGAGIWVEGEDLGFAVWGADVDLAPNQFENGERMSFKVWDCNADVEWDVRATLANIQDNGTLNWTDGALTTLRLDYRSVYECVVPFGAGWNLVSININPPQDLWNNNGPDIRQMMSQFRAEDRHHVILMKNEAGNFYAPANRDFNNIPFWDVAQGYQVRMDQAIEGRWTGVQIEANADVPIAAGWNMIAYYPTYQLTCARNTFNAIRPIINNVILTKDGFGHFASPPNNFSNMDPWREGRGYQIKVNAAVVLNYPAQQQGAAAIQVGESDAAVVGHWAAPVRTGANMSVLVTGISGADLAADDQVAAFNANGRLVGLGSVTDGMVGLAVWGDDASTEVVDGLLDKEAFTLKLWDADKKVEIGLNMGDLAYETDGFVASDAVAGRIIPDVYSLGQNFPNPFNAVTKLSFGMPEASRVSIRVFDIAGREVATLVSGNLEAGNHTAVWNAEGFNSGVYLVKMETPSFSDVRKVTLIK